MPNLPAFCDTCGTAFSSGFYVDNCINISFFGNKSGPCPNCGGDGSIPDGVFNVFGNVIEIIDAPRKTIEQLKSFVDFLNSAKKQEVDSESLRQKIKNEMPELSGLSSFIPKTRTELYAFLSLIIAFLTLVISLNNCDKGATNNININTVIQNVLAPNENDSIHSDKTHNFSTPSRNEICPCNSGNKYKNCCGGII